MSVFKFVEPPENNEKPMDQKSTVKFKIMSLKVKGPTDYIPELARLILIVFQINNSFPKFIMHISSIVIFLSQMKLLIFIQSQYH